MLLRSNKNLTCQILISVNNFIVNDVQVSLYDINVLEKSGAWYSIVDQGTGELIAKLQGMANVYKYLENPDNESALTMIEDFVDSQITI